MSRTKKIEPIRIETARRDLVIIQMLAHEDDKAYFDLQNVNSKYWKEFGNKIYKSVEEVTKERLEHGNGSFGIWLKNKLIGWVGYSTKNHAREAEVGVLLDENATGHGYASSSVKALTEFAKPRFDRVYAEVTPNNDKSIALLDRSGYKTSGKIIERDWGKALVFEAPK